MSNHQSRTNTPEELLGASRTAFTVTLLASSFGLMACGPLVDDDYVPLKYRCNSYEDLAFEKTRDDHTCGAGDENIGPEPSYDDIKVCETLSALKSGPDEAPDGSDLDTKRIQDALTRCATKGAVKLVADGSNDSFVASHISMSKVILWVDKDVTLYASRNANLYQGPLGNCGVLGVNDSTACQDFISVNDEAPGIVGDGTIDGQGGEPLIGHSYSWWEMSGALRDIDGSIGNPTLINVLSNTTKFLMYRITLHDSPKFHVKVSSSPMRGVSNPVCNYPGEGFKIWGVTILTPSKWYNSQGRLMSPQWARNTDGIDPGANSVSSCGVIACSTITTGDDHIAIKGGHHVSNLRIAHNHFGTGHGMSIGSETMGDAVDDATGQRLPAIDDVWVYDLTIDADSRWVGEDASPNDFNGIRIKSDPSRGGWVKGVTYSDVCMRDMSNSILISTSYNPLFSGIPKYMPKFEDIAFRNIRGVTCMSQTQTVVSVSGYSVNNITGPVSFDNVVFDNIGPQSTLARFSDIVMGPGNVNFDFPSNSLGTTVEDNRLPDSSKPKTCRFPTLPVPTMPEGWVW